MKELIKIDEEERVDVRDLHEFLGVGTRYDKWFKRRVEYYGFKEGRDYTVSKNDLSEITSLQVTLDIAKQLCMVERTKKGQEARDYFLEVEKKWKQNPYSTLHKLKAAIEHSIYLEEEQARLKREAEAQATLIKAHSERLAGVEDRVATIAGDSGYRTAVAFAKRHAFLASNTLLNKIGRQASMTCRNRGVDIGKAHHELYDSVNTYPEEILKEVFRSNGYG